MTWLTNIAILVLVLSVGNVSCRKHSSSSNRSPWAKPKKASNFMNCLIQNIADSPVFPQQEKEDLESIVETMMSAVQGITKSKGSNTKAKMQAMDTAIASSLAEMVVAEDAGDPQKVQIKTEALMKAVQKCFVSVMGHVNRQFMVEMRDLIEMFTREAAANAASDADEDYEDEDDEDITLDEGITLQEPDFNNKGTDYPESSISGLDVNLGVPSTGGITASLSPSLVKSLLKSSVVQAVFNSRSSPKDIKEMLGGTLNALAQNLGLNANTSNAMKRDSIQAVSRVRPGSDTSAYMSAIVESLIRSLTASGTLNDSNARELGSKLASGFVEGTGKAAVAINMPGMRNIDLLSDIRGIKTSFDTNFVMPSGIDAQVSLGADIPYLGVSSEYNFNTEGSGVPRSGALASLLNSEIGFTSPKGISRINVLSSSIVRGLGKGGLNANALSEILNSVRSQLISSGVNPSDAAIETVIEVMVSMLQVLGSSEVKQAIPALSPENISAIGKVLSSLFV